MSDPGHRPVPPGMRVVVFVVAFGATFPLQQVALRSWPPFLLVGVRCFVGGLAMVGAAGGPSSVWRAWRRLDKRLALLLVPALCNSVLVTAGIIEAVRLLHSGGEAALLAYTQPLFFVLLAHRFMGYRLSAVQVGALGVGFAGVALVTLPLGSVRWDPWGLAAGLGAAMAWAGGVTFLRAYTGAAAADDATRRRILAVVGGPQFVVGGLALLVWGSATESWLGVRWSGEALWSAAWFTACGTLGWLAYLSLVGDAPVGRVASWSFGVPVVANVAGVALLREHVDAALVLGGLAVVAGIVVVESVAPRHARDMTAAPGP